MAEELGFVLSPSYYKIFWSVKSNEFDLTMFEKLPETCIDHVEIDNPIANDADIARAIDLISDTSSMERVELYREFCLLPTYKRF